MVEDPDPFDTKKQIAAILHSPEEEIKARVSQCKHLCQLSCKLLGYRSMVCFSLTYRSSLISMIVVCLP